MTEALSSPGTVDPTPAPPKGASSFSALIRLLRYARGYRRRVLLASTCSALNTLFDVMPEILIGIAIDVVVNQEASFVAGLGFATPKSQIASCSAC